MNRTSNNTDTSGNPPVKDQPRALCLDNIAITGMGLNTAAGSEPVALFGAVAANLGYIKPDPVLEAPATHGEGVENIMTCAIEHLEEEDPHARMLACLIPALFNAIEDADMLDKPRQKPLLYLVVPGQDTARGECLYLEDLYATLQSELVELGEIEIRIKEAAQGATEHLMFVAQALQQGQWGCVMFAAVDSLLDELTCMELGKDLRIQTEQTSDGVVPGEAAACIVLEQLNSVSDLDDLPYGWLKGLAIQDEPNHGNADLTRLEGLGLAMRSVFTACGISKERISSLVLAMGTEQTDMIEWHQTENALWPHQASEQETTALRLGEVEQVDPLPPSLPEKLYLNQSLGDMGVASVAVSIILAMARMEFVHPVCKRNLILESGHSPHRGVIYVKHPTGGKSKQQLLDEVA